MAILLVEAAAAEGVEVAQQEDWAAEQMVLVAPLSAVQERQIPEVGEAEEEDFLPTPEALTWGGREEVEQYLSLILWRRHEKAAGWDEMSVLATLELATGEWTFNVAPESPSPSLEIGFKQGGGPVPQFDGLAFGFTVVANGLPVLTKAYPPQGVRYVATDQTYLTNDRVDLAPDDEVVLAVWTESAGQRYEDQTMFVIPRPEQPFPSWVWENGQWTPPVPYPDDGGFYAWDENGQIWATVDPISE